MNVDREAAAAALNEADVAGARVKTVKLYAGAAPFMILWGVIWLCGNASADLWPAASRYVWLTGGVLGTLLTVLITVRNARSWEQRYSLSPMERKVIGRRASLLGFTLMAFLPAVFAIAGPLSARQGNALASLIWAFVYMIGGAVVGWRLFAIGLVTAVAIEFGYFFVHQHYYLWMGVVSGGALIAGGLWLRKI